MVEIGLDPGTGNNYGMAVIIDGQLDRVGSTNFIAVLHELIGINQEIGGVLVKIENPEIDSSTWSAYNATKQKPMLKIAEGVGRNKELARQTIEWMKHYWISYEEIAPSRRDRYKGGDPRLYNMPTKMDADTFKKYTGWKSRTNEHGRDAAMLIYAS